MVVIGTKAGVVQVVQVVQVVEVVVSDVLAADLGAVQVVAARHESRGPVWLRKRNA